MSCTYEIDFAGVATIDEFHKRVRNGITVPSYYRDNLDALNDLFSETNGRIIISGIEAVDEDMIPYIERFKTMCIDATAENPILEIIFV